MRLDTLATVLLIPATITAVLVFVRKRSLWSGVAVLLLIAVFVVTFAVNLPINADQAGWAVANPPADWAEVRDRW